jgi:hypothetical protein
VARRWPATVRTGYLGSLDGGAWPVGFSPTGTALPDALTDVLLRGSHAVRAAQRVEAQRRERATAIAAHVDNQIGAFLAMCADEDLVPPVSVRVVRDVPRLARAGHRNGRPQAALRAGDENPGRPARDTAARSARRRRRRERLRAWAVLHWRCESFPSAGRSLHLFVEPGGRTFEGRDDPSPLTVLGQEVRVWPVDAASIVEGMAEVDARRAALHLVHGMAQLLWRAGVGL